MYIILRSIITEISGKSFRMALVFALVLFFVDTMNAQPVSPQASRLIGTIQSVNFIGAVFSDSKGEQTFFRVFDTLPDGSQITAVRADSIVLKGADGTSYEMYIAHDRIISPPARTVAPLPSDTPPDPYAPGAIRRPDSEQSTLQTLPHVRHERTRSEDE